MSKVRELLCMLAVLASCSAAAADNQGKFALKGAGLLPCGVFTSERASGSQAYYLIGGWIEGYVSAHNKLLPNTYDITSFEGSELLLKIVDSHCLSNPQDKLHGVVDGIIAKLATKKLTDYGPKLKIAEGDRVASLYRHTVKQMQQRLTELELYKGPVNGVFSDATQAALIAYQSDIRYEATGFPDQATLWRLLRE